MKKIQITVLILLLSGISMAQSLTTYTNSILGSQFTFDFSNPKWRSEIGRPMVFASEKGKESRFFAYGLAYTGVDVSSKKKDDGPYAGVNDLVNYMILFDVKKADNYINLVSGKGLFAWVYFKGFSTHEKNYDTDCYFHLLIYAPKWPKNKDVEIYYCEDYRSGGTAEVFTLEKGSNPRLVEENGKLLIEAKLEYDPKFGGAEAKISLEISGLIELSHYNK